MRIRVKSNSCQGYNRCKSIAPELFDLDEFGMATAINEGFVKPKHEPIAKLAVENCPEFAIEIITEADSKG